MSEIFLPIVYEDETILICNKPSGLLSIKDGYDPDLPNAHGILGHQKSRLWIVHRLDKETSGLLLFAKTSQAHKDMNLQFEARNVKKKYHAITHGIPDWKEKDVDLPLRVNGDKLHRTIVDPHRGKPAHTCFKVLSINDMHSYMDVNLGSGYTHQIRSHLAFMGYPILNDRLYMDYASRILHRLKRPMPAKQFPDLFGLHAYSLRFDHPKDHQVMHITIEDPAPFQAYLRVFKRTGCTQ
jgi:tRNA pseudouridine32 synthase/23S rRNA pseudouridine746 synthase